MRRAGLLRLFRFSVIALLAVLVHDQAVWNEQQRAQPISLRKAHHYFPKATGLRLRDPERGLYFVVDAGSQTIGCLLTTSPDSDDIVGYSGPNNLLVALDASGGLVGVELLDSGDTPEHVERVRLDKNFLKSFLGWKPAQGPPPQAAAVSGASLTSSAISEAIQKRLAGAAPSLRFPEPVTLREVQTLFTNAVAIAVDQSRLRVLDGSGRLLGYALRTSPQADNVRGYAGPTECLVAVATDGRTVTGLQLRRSYDTDSYVGQLRRDPAYLRQFVGRTIEDVADPEPRTKRIHAISGATQTSQAVERGLQRRMAVELRGREDKRWRPRTRDWALAAVIAMAALISFTPLRGRPRLRIAWQVLLVAYVGVVNRDLLSLALFGGWATHGLALKAAPGLVLLGAAAFIFPLTTRRQLYCHHLCPHGAAQQLLGKLGLRRWQLPPRWQRVLEFVPGLLLAFALGVILLDLPVNLGSIEAFDAWNIGLAGLGTLVVAALGLVASLFVPQAYCRFGCPTGALLNFIRSTGHADHWSRRDAAGLMLLVAAMATVVTVRGWPRHESIPEPLALQGRAMGTSWSVKIRDEVAEPATLQKGIAAELEWAESMTSNWRPSTDLSEFNRTATTNALPVPWPVLMLCRWGGEISLASGGSFDVTVAPLLRLWGFGPGAVPGSIPTDEAVTEVLPAVGWQKLHVLDGLMRKEHPNLEVDLSSIAEGWAVDLVTHHLEQRGYTNFLVEVGGEIRVRGRWVIAIEVPMRNRELMDEAISTSGSYRQNHISEGKQYSHLIDPRKGRPITHSTTSVTVRHADCAHADAWSTALNVLGVEAGLPLANQLGLAAQFVVKQPGQSPQVRSSQAW